jgi:hypothetical protein
MTGTTYTIRGVLAAAPAEVAAEVGPDGLSAATVVDALAQVHPAPNARDNSRNCVGDGGMGCAGLVTTDLISVCAWPDEAGAARQAEVFGADRADRVGRFVLSYAGRRGDEVVSDDVRAEWESAARELVTDGG